MQEQCNIIVFVIFKLMKFGTVSIPGFSLSGSSIPRGIENVYET